MNVVAAPRPGVLIEVPKPSTPREPLKPARASEAANARPTTAREAMLRTIARIMGFNLFSVSDQVHFETMTCARG